MHDAIGSFRRAVIIDPNYFEAYASWGGALTPTRKWRRASEILREALVLRNDSAEGLYLLAFALMHICEWEELGTVLVRLKVSVTNRISRGESPGVEPYASITFPWPPKLLRSIAQSHAKAAESYALPPLSLPRTKFPKSRKQLHLALKSYDIGEHQSSYLAVEVIGILARRGHLKLSIFCLRQDDGSELRRAIQAAQGLTFHDVSRENTGAIASLINGQGVNVLVDMDAHFRNSRLDVMASRPAPVRLAVITCRVASLCALCEWHAHAAFMRYLLCVVCNISTVHAMQRSACTQLVFQKTPLVNECSACIEPALMFAGSRQCKKQPTRVVSCAPL